MTDETTCTCGETWPCRAALESELVRLRPVLRAASEYLAILRNPQLVGPGERQAAVNRLSAVVENCAGMEERS